MPRKAKNLRPEQLEVAKDLYTRIGPNKGCKELGISANTFRRIAKEQGWDSPREVVARQRAPLTQEEIDRRVIQDYPRMGRRLAHELGYSEEKIRKDALRLGVQSLQGEARAGNRGSFNEDYFRVWTPAMAYDLGNGFADGSVFQVRGKYGCYSLKVKRDDESIILGTRERIGSQHNIKRWDAVQKNGKITPVTRVAMSSQKLFDSLIEIGLIPNKSNTDIPFQNIHDEFLPHFARGYFDGDGSVGLYHYPKQDKVIAYWMGTATFLTELTRRVRAATGMSAGNYRAPSRSKSPLTRLQQWQAVPDIRLLYQYFYPTGDYPYLARKKEAFEAILQTG